MSQGPSIDIREFDSRTTRGAIDTVIVPIWERVYGDVATADPFFSTERFLDRVAGYTRSPGFGMFAALRSDIPIGLAFGYPLAPGGRWWNGLQITVPSDFIHEDGKRTFAINEIMVDANYRRQGIATRLHSALLSSRRESRATLLVEPENEAARAAYLHWGWSDVGELKPFPDSPTYMSMILSLPLRALPA
jgi:ribosomal protein S18 acetylase RimI-like enzyme